MRTTKDQGKAKAPPPPKREMVNITAYVLPPPPPIEDATVESLLQAYELPHAQELRDLLHDDAPPPQELLADADSVWGVRLSILRNWREDCAEFKTRSRFVLKRDTEEALRLASLSLSLDEAIDATIVRDSRDAEDVAIVLPRSLQLVERLGVARQRHANFTGLLAESLERYVNGSGQGGGVTLHGGRIVCKNGVLQKRSLTADTDALEAGEYEHGPVVGLDPPQKMWRCSEAARRAYRGPPAFQILLSDLDPTESLGKTLMRAARTDATSEVQDEHVAERYIQEQEGVRKRPRTMRSKGLGAEKQRSSVAAEATV